jgi:glycosyltransferase involved in cell wall biosynthesis
MATYNGEKYIGEQLDSILNQLSNEDEVIISDDGSTDKTLDIIESYHDKRIRIFHHVPDKRLRASKVTLVNLVTKNFENALLQVKGDYVFLSDQDDVWLPNKVEVMLRYLKDYDYVVSDAYITDGLLNVIYESRFIVGRHRKTHNKYKALLTSAEPYQGGCAAFRCNVLLRALPFPSKLQSHDRWIGFVCSFFYKYVIIPDKLIYYRRHDLNTSFAVAEKSPNTLIYRIKTRLYYILSLLRLSIE